MVRRALRVQAGHRHRLVRQPPAPRPRQRQPRLRSARPRVLAGRDAGKPVAGSLLAFLVADVDAEHERLSRAGLEIVLPLVTEPWGQRRFQVAAPDGLFVEVLQSVAPDPAWLAANGLGAS
ncbi:VOC family protein [Nannocystis pusilla]|uniref:VOC family protein n=1 Tax=Nannocystis pusilla TaxID=889268 RepID=UPI003B7ACF7D